MNEALSLKSLLRDRKSLKKPRTKKNNNQHLRAILDLSLLVQRKALIRVTKKDR